MLKSPDTITKGLASAYIATAKRAASYSLLGNVQAAALSLRLMTYHVRYSGAILGALLIITSRLQEIIALDQVEEDFWRELFGDEAEVGVGTLLGAKLLGPLQGAVFIDPIFLFNPVNLASDSPCMEEYMLVSPFLRTSSIKLCLLLSSDG
jgi:hypothetical protein